MLKGLAIVNLARGAFGSSRKIFDLRAASSAAIFFARSSLLMWASSPRTRTGAWLDGRDLALPVLVLGAKVHSWSSAHSRRFRTCSSLRDRPSLYSCILRNTICLHFLLFYECCLVQYRLLICRARLREMRLVLKEGNGGTWLQEARSMCCRW